MNPHADQPAHIPFDQQTREQLLQTKHVIEGRIRAAKQNLREEQRAGNRAEVDRLHDRISRLKSAASAAALELALRNERRRAESEAFVRAARSQLPVDLFERIRGMAHA